MHWHETETETDDKPTDATDADSPVDASPEQVEKLAVRILGGLSLEVSVSVRDTEENLEVDIDGADRDFLLEHRGEGLNALQYLLNRIIYRGHRGKKIHVDSAGYRKGREDEIVEIALRTADMVKESGKESAMSPLNPYERRLVHVALGEVEGIATRSIGDGFLKRVSIFPDRESGAGNEPTDS
jgi:spoIIIJ-associated protein